MLSPALATALEDHYASTVHEQPTHDSLAFGSSHTLLFSLLALSSALPDAHDELRIAFTRIWDGSRSVCSRLRHCRRAHAHLFPQCESSFPRSGGDSSFGDTRGSTITHRPARGQDASRAHYLTNRFSPPIELHPPRPPFLNPFPPRFSDTLSTAQFPTTSDESGRNDPRNRNLVCSSVQIRPRQSNSSDFTSSPAKL